MVVRENNINNADECKKLKQSLISSFYAILSPPPCQVEEQEPPDATVDEKGKGCITFCLSPHHPSDNKIAL
jgi:hypothetical protein